MAEIEAESHHCDSLCVPVRLPLIIDHFFLLLLLLLSLTGQVDLWTRTSSGCPCASNKTLAGRSSNSGESCSCCVRGGCQCEDNPLRCAQCGLESYCTNSKLTTVTICSLSLTMGEYTLHFDRNRKLSTTTISDTMHVHRQTERGGVEDVMCESSVVVASDKCENC